MFFGFWSEKSILLSEVLFIGSYCFSCGFFKVGMKLCRDRVLE